MTSFFQLSLQLLFNLLRPSFLSPPLFSFPIHPNWTSYLGPTSVQLFSFQFTYKLPGRHVLCFPSSLSTSVAGHNPFSMVIIQDLHDFPQTFNPTSQIHPQTLSKWCPLIALQGKKKVISPERLSFFLPPSPCKLTYYKLILISSLVLDKRGIPLYLYQTSFNGNPDSLAFIHFSYPGSLVFL